MEMNNWKTPKSEKLVELERLMAEQTAEIRALCPNYSHDEVADILLATPLIAKLFDELTDEFRAHSHLARLAEKSVRSGARLRRLLVPCLADVAKPSAATH
jgi:hypothetical protein